MSCFRISSSLVLTCVALTTIIGCGGEDGSSSQNRKTSNNQFQGNASNALPGLDSLLGNTQTLPGIGEMAGDDDFKGDVSALANLLGNMSPNDQERLLVILDDRIDNCNFLPLGGNRHARGISLPAGCSSGNVETCVGSVADMAGNIFVGFLQKLDGALGPVSGAAVRDAIIQEAGLCASTNISNPKVFREKLNEKLQQCKMGDLRGCVGMLMLFLKSFLAGLMSLVSNMLG